MGISNELDIEQNKDKQIYDYDKIDKKSKHKVKYHNVIITLLALMVMPVYLYGMQVLVLMLTALVTALVVDFMCVKIFMRGLHQKHDYSSIVTALVTVMLMPATVPPYVIVVSITISLCIAKYPFGGTGHNIFNPAAVGVAFTTLCWPDLVLKYPVPGTTYGLPDLTHVQYALSPASILRVGGTPKIDVVDIMLGKYTGPLGTTCMIVLAACLLYLTFRNVISKRIVFSALFVVCGFAVLSPRLITGTATSLLYELSSGAFVFGIIFMANDPTTNPNTKAGRIFYGVLIGLFVVIFRNFGQIELEFVYAILLANVFAASCDSYAGYLSSKLHELRTKTRKKANENTTEEIAAEEDTTKEAATTETAMEENVEKPETVKIEQAMAAAPKGAEEDA